MSEPVGGDPVCWIQFTCDECGAFQDDREAQTCWRCGVRLNPEQTS